MNPGTQFQRHNQAQIDYFAARPKPRMVPRDTPYVRRQIERLLDFGGIRPEDRLVEVGCGMGRYTVPLVEMGYRVEGLDLTGALLDQLREFLGPDRQIPLHHGDVTDLAAPLAGGFDAVIGFFTLHHVHDLGRCMDAMARMLRPGGPILFLEPNPYCLLYYAQVALGTVGLIPHMSWQGEKGILKMRRGPVFAAFAAAGLVRPRLARFGCMPPLLANTAPGRALERAVEALPPARPALAFQLFAAQRP